LSGREPGGEKRAPGWLQGIAGQLQDALRWLEEAQERDKENRLLYRVLAAVLQKQAEVEKEALRRLEEAGAAEELRRRARRIAFTRRSLLEEAGGLPEPLLDEEWLREKLLEIAEAAMEAGWSPEARAAPILSPVERSLLSTRELVEDLLRGRLDLLDAWAGAVSTSRDNVAALTYWLLQPLLSAARLAAGQALGWLHEYWQQGRCPVCGAPAAVGYMRGEGRRQVMHCTLCHMEWRFPRAKCPACGADRPGDVVFYQADPERPWLRLYHCRRCGHTWRTVDEEHEALPRSSEKLPPRILYDLYTAHLTYLAEKLAQELAREDERR